MSPARGLGGRDLVLVLLICIAWALNFLTSAYALREIPPFLFTAVRLAILALLLGAFVKPPAAGQWPRLVAVALCNGVLHFGLSFWALQLADNLSSPAIVMQSYVPMAALLAWIAQFVGHRIEGRKPSFLTDLTYLLIGPAWVLAKLYRKLGWNY